MGRGLPFPAGGAAAARRFPDDLGQRAAARRRSGDGRLSLAAPLERRSGQISGVTEMTSVSSLGGSSITIQFDLDRNIDGAARDVQAAINAAASEPADQPARSRPRIAKSIPADAPDHDPGDDLRHAPRRRSSSSPTKSSASASARSKGVSQVIIGGGAKIGRARAGQSRRARLHRPEPRGHPHALGQVNVNAPKGSVDGEERPTSSTATISCYRGRPVSRHHPRAAQRHADPLQRRRQRRSRRRRTRAGRLFNNQARGAPGHLQTAGRECHRDDRQHPRAPAAVAHLAAAEREARRDAAIARPRSARRSRMCSSRSCSRSRWS